MEHKCIAKEVSRNDSLRDLLTLLVEDHRNEAAWGEFFHRFDAVIHRMVGAALGRLCPGHGADVGDVVQQVYCRLLEHDRRALHNFRGTTEAGFHAYLSSIVYNLVRDRRACLNQFLLRVAEGPAEDGPYARRRPPISRPNQEHAVEEIELQELIKGVLHASDNKANRQRDRLVFALRFYDGYSAKEVARALGITVDCVNTIYHRLRKKIELEIRRRWSKKPLAWKDKKSYRGPGAAFGKDPFPRGIVCETPFSRRNGVD